MSSVPPPPTPPAGAAPAATPMSPEDQRLWATLTHVGGIFFSFVPALVTYLVFKDRGGFIREHTATALNFQLTMLIGYLIGGVLSLILIGFLVVFAVGILIIVFSIIAAIKANSGELYSYPLTIKFVK